MICSRRHALPLFIAAMALPHPAGAQEIGAGLLAVPGHQGSDRMRIIPIPLIDATAGPFFLNTTDGAGVQIRQGAATLGLSATYLIGYSQRDLRDGTGRVSDALGVRAFARMTIGPAVIGGQMTQAVAGGTGGATGEASITFPIMLTPELALAPGIAVGWADRRHNERYFNPAGSGDYTARAGFKDVTASVTGRYRAGERITLTATAGASRLLPVVAEAPIVRQRTNASGMIGMSYRF
ncbi:hypothetical protein GRI97_16605 [Altererythrobacter xixiisoli]|uniref:MipA/OmpV family protein n=1 Tax=Croceibacterium xixiisoli TaxID=1476466 RepID=A0A6I4TXG9_9SPHN|nr:MipA/OmpV family protein [Croceibacterium xixiisoli]MXP00613.1 hypothetical protein [Croceibacterium xixiisoli]